MPGDPNKSKAGRQVMGVVESQVWVHRIGKEDGVNAKANPSFSLRNVVGSVDVPAKFKPGHIDPARELKNNKRWEPADNGWSASSAETREFQRCLNAQTAGPRAFQAYPATAAQELGWLLSHAGAPEHRIKKQQNNRLGIGWDYKDPSEWGQSDACRTPASAHSNSLPTMKGSRAGAAPEVSQTAPYAVSVRIDRVSDLARSTSAPALVLPPAEQLRKRDAKAAKAVANCLRYQNSGDFGHKHSKFLNGTDATKFDNDFTVANCGVPLYKMTEPETVVLKDKGGMQVPKWR